MNTLRFLHKVVFTVEIFDNSLRLNLYKQTNFYGDKKKTKGKETYGNSLGKVILKTNF